MVLMEGDDMKAEEDEQRGKSAFRRDEHVQMKWG